LGQPFIDYFSRIKQSELRRWEQAEDKDDFQRREYFSRI
jgi:glutamine synthetase